MLYREEALRNRYEQFYGKVKIKVPTLAYLNTGTIFVLVIGVTCLLLFGEYNKKISIKGYISPSKGIVRVYPKATGIVQAILVQEGQLVKKGDVLLEMTGRQNETNEADKYSDKTIEILYRSNAEIEAKIFSQKRRDAEMRNGIGEKIEELSRRIDGVVLQVEIQKKKIEVINSQLNDASTLLEKGYASKFEIANLRTQKLVDEQELEALHVTHKAVSGELEQARTQYIAFPIESEIRLATLRQELSENEIKINEQRSRISWQVRATSSGAITLIRISPGQEVKNEFAMMSIVPEDSKFQAIAFVPTRSMAEVVGSLRAVIKYEAFPYQEFGFQQGIVSEVSSIPILPGEGDGEFSVSEPSYRIIIDLVKRESSTRQRAFNLRPGLLIDADIVLRKQRLLDLLIPLSWE